MPLLEVVLIWRAGWQVPPLAPWPMPMLPQLESPAVTQVRLHEDVSLTGHSTADLVRT